MNPSVPSIDRKKASKVFGSVVSSHVQDVLPAVEDRLREVLNPDETLPDVAMLATLMGRVQDDGTGRLIEADKAHFDELSGDTEVRARRDAAAERVRTKLVEIRRISDGLFGPVRSAQVLAAEGETAPVTQPEILWRQGEHTVTRLESPAFTVPTMTTASLQFDPALMASELRTDTDLLRQALDDVELEQRKAETTLAAKKTLIDETSRLEAACGRMFEGFFLLVDRTDLLERFRGALRRLRRRSRPGAGDGEVPDSGEPDGGAPPEGTPQEGAPQDGEPFGDTPFEGESDVASSEG